MSGYDLTDIAPEIIPGGDGGGGGGGGGTVDISAGSVTALADAIAADIAGEALTVNATVSNEVEVKNDAGSAVPVTVGNFPAGFAVVGAVEVTNDVGNPLPVSGTVVTGGLTDTQLRATPVPVSGAVTISDGSGPVTVDGAVALAAGAAVVGALVANQSVNAAQINGVTPLMGNGPTGTGALRVSIANDSTGIVALASGATVTVNTVGVAATSLGKAEDAVAASGDSGVFMLAIQRAAPASNVGASGRYAEVQMSPANGMFVAPTPIQAEIVVTPAISAQAYTAGMQLGVAVTFAGAALASGRAGQIVGARLVDKAKQKANVSLDIYALTPALVGADHAAYDVLDAATITAIYIGTIDFLAANYHDTNSNSRCVGSVNGGAPILPFNTSGSSSLFGVFYTTGTPTYASTTDLVAYLSCVQF